MERFFLSQDSASHWFAVNVEYRAPWETLKAAGPISTDAPPSYAVLIEDLDRFEFKTFYYPNQPGGAV